MSSDAVVDAANSRLERLYAQADTLLANLSATRTAQVAAETKATVHRTRLVQLGRQAQFTRSALEQSTIDSYIGGGGPLGEMAAALESLTSPSLNLSASSLATVNYLIKPRAQLISQAKSMQSAEVTMSTRATAAIAGATSATNTAARAKSAMDAVIARQQTALDGVRAAETVQIRRAAGLRITLLRSGSLLAKTADRQLARALGGRNYTLLMEQRRGELLQRPAAIKCTMRPLCRSGPEPASRCSPVAQRDELRLRAPERVGPVCHRGLPVVRRAGRGKAETPAAGGHSWNEQTRTRPRG